MLKQKTPKLSIVVTARNDDHGGGFLKRMQVFVNGLLAQCERHRLKAELIIVEWNPPPDRPSLSEVLNWHQDFNYCTVRVIRVPPAIHRRHIYSDRLGLYQMIAKNVGIRRARGEFCLATNIDILFSHELIHWLASSNLKSNCFYRIDRYDVPEDIPVDASIDEQLDYCKKNILRISARHGTYSFMTGRYYQSFTMLNSDLTRLHYNASGDFTLLSRKDWFALRGYPEFDMYSPHIDTLFILMAHHAGIRQEILKDPMRIYHIEHSSSMSGEKVDRLVRDISSKGIPQIRISQLEEWAEEMNKNGAPILFNGEDWGLASKDLEEEWVVTALWEEGMEAVYDNNRVIKKPFSLSVILFAEKGGKYLKGCLDSLKNQRLTKEDYEVLIVGEKGRIEEDILGSYSGEMTLRQVFIEGKNPSRAWKKGVEEAKGEVVLFLKDDCIADRDLLSTHLGFHRSNPPVNRGILALYEQEEYVMIGKSEWDSGVKPSPLKAFLFKDYKTLNNGALLNWRFFRCNNLSLRRDFIIRYGNFDELFGDFGDIELGYRLFKHNMRIVYNSNARVYKTSSVDLEEFCRDSYSEGRFAFVFEMKHPDLEVKLWCKRDGLLEKMKELEKDKTTFLKAVEKGYLITPQVLESLSRLSEYYRLKGIGDAIKKKTEIIREIFHNKPWKKAKPEGEKTILIISDRLPLYDLNYEDERLFQMIDCLSKSHHLIFLVRMGVHKGRYIEELRKMGICVFLDERVLRRQSLGGYVILHYTSPVRVEDILTSVDCDLIILNSVESMHIYMPLIRESSPQSVLAFNLYEAVQKIEGNGNIIPFLYNQADLIITSQRNARSLLSSGDLKVVVLPDTSDRVALEKRLLQMMDSLPEPGCCHTKAFNIHLDSPPPLSSLFEGKRRVGGNGELLAVFTVSTAKEITRVCLETAQENSNGDITSIVAAIKADIDPEDKIAMRFEQEGIPYFKYKTEKEVLTFLSAIAKQEGYRFLSLIDSTLLLPPHWDRRVLGHFMKDCEIGVVTLSRHQLGFKDLYEFEDRAWEAYERHRGKCLSALGAEVPFFVINSSLIKDDLYPSFDELFKGVIKKGYKIAKAEDILVWEVVTGIKKADRGIQFTYPEMRLMSVVIPSDGDSDKLKRCLESLFVQRNIKPDTMEIIIVFYGSKFPPTGFFKEKNYPFKVRCLFEPSECESSALNRGIKEALGRYCLFLSDDVVADRDLIVEHLKIQLKNEKDGIALIGNITNLSASPFMRFLIENPDIQHIPYYSFDYKGLSDIEYIPFYCFYPLNISLKRELFKEVGLFNEALREGWEWRELGVRFALNGNRILYNRKAVVNTYREVNLKGFLHRQLYVGRQYAVEAIKHPANWNLEVIKMACARYLFGKEGLVDFVRDLSFKLEEMPEDIRNNFKFLGSSLLHRCYIILSNYAVAKGIGKTMNTLEGEGWLDRFIEKKGLDRDGISRENSALKLLLEAFFKAGNGVCNSEFVEAMEKAIRLCPSSPEIHYVLGRFYLDSERYRLAEDMLEKAIALNNKRGMSKEDSLGIIPPLDEAMCFLGLALSCIPQGKYRKAALVLERLISERIPTSIDQQILLYKSLGLCYKAMGEERRSLFCMEEVERLVHKASEGV